MQSESNTSAWIIFLASLLMLSLAATPYWRAADQLLIAIRLSIVVAVSILLVRAKWRRRDSDVPHAPHDRGESLLLRLRRWYYGE